MHVKTVRDVLVVALSGALALASAAGCSSDPGKLGENEQGLASQNGLTTNALTRNALTRNALTRNALTRNALTRNALTRNALTRNALTLTNDALATLQSGGATPEDIQQERALRGSARKLLEYVYSCAMPSDASVALDFPTDGADGSSCDGGTLSPDGLTCSYGTLTGQLNLAPNWGTDVCDESCQRWVSACVLARTNYYGVKVDISIRGAHPALVASDEEKAQYPLREGTYFGNIFNETTDASNNVVWQPEYHACGGPGSNQPMVTKRFCSSTAAGCIIDVQPSCACPEVDASAYPQSYYTAFAGDPSSFLSVGLSFTCDTAQRSCSGVGADGAMTGCTSETGAAYPESVTVFLKNAAICGNGVCESGEDTGSCSADCLPNVWASRYASIADAYTKGVAPLSDESIVMAGVAETWEPVDLGLGDIMPIAGGNYAKPFLGRFSSTGQLIWGHPIAPTPVNPYFIVEQPLSAVATTRDDHIIAVGDSYDAQSGGTGDIEAKEGWVMSLTKDGNIAWQHSYVTGTRQHIVRLRGLDTDAANSVIFAGSFTGTVSFGGDTFTSGFSGVNEDLYVVKLDANGSHVWSKQIGTTYSNGNAKQDWIQNIDVDASGNTLVLSCTQEGCDTLTKLGPDGTTLWTKLIGTGVDRVTTDGAGNVYISGGLGGPFDFGGGLVTGQFPAIYVAKYDPDGVYASAQLAFSGDASAWMWTGMLQVDTDGSVVLGGTFTHSATSGTATYDAGANQDVFVTKVTAAGPSWFKQFGGALSDLFGGAMVVNGRVIVTGDLQAAMLFEQKLLVASTQAPPPWGYWGDLFLGSFPDPTSSTPNNSCAFVPAGTPCVDRDAPVITLAPSNYVEQSTHFDAIVVDATGPTFDVSRVISAIDDHDGPVAVDCRQLDYAMQPIEQVNPNASAVAGAGWNHMSCKATDQAGNYVFRRLTLWVKDTTPPTVSPPTVTVFDATTATGASVVYFPIFADNTELSSSVQPYCTPYSGSAFPLGSTTVSCQVTDRFNNVGYGSFDLTVRFAWSGFKTPTVNQTFTRGSTVKASFTLTGGSAAVANAVAQLYYAPMVGTVVGPETNAGNFAYSKRTGYTASFATRKLAAGTYRLRVDLHDGVLRTTTIKLI